LTKAVESTKRVGPLRKMAWELVTMMAWELAMMKA
jgi:hypothetical protein